MERLLRETFKILNLHNCFLLQLTFPVLHLKLVFSIFSSSFYFIESTYAQKQLFTSIKKGSFQGRAVLIFVCVLPRISRKLYFMLVRMDPRILSF